LHFGLHNFSLNSPMFQSMYGGAMETYKHLTDQFGEDNVLFYYTGCKGFRIMWFDPKMYFQMNWRDHKKFYTHITTNVFPAYFPKKMWTKIQPFLDNAPYRQEAGLKPDIGPHYFTKFYPQQCHNTLRLNLLQEDEELTTKIIQFWRTIVTNLRSDVSFVQFDSPSFEELFEELRLDFESQ